MDVFRKVTNFNFLAATKFMAVSSTLLVLACFWSFVVNGFVLGLDFSGGTLMEVSYSKNIEDLGTVRNALAADGFPDAFVQHFGSPKDVIVRLGGDVKEGDNAANNRAFAAMQKVTGGGTAELRRVEYVGPQVGKELVEDGGLAILYSLIGILIYVAVRFEYRFAIGAIVATIHDVIITVGVFSLWQLEFDVTVLAAVLSVIGYSLNDTVVVFDRIRENFRRVRKGSVTEIINLSLNETLSRTIITSGGTVLAVVTLYLFGGKIIQGFSMAMLIGIAVGTYSSIYVASATVVALGINRSNMVAPKREIQFDDLP